MSPPTIARLIERFPQIQAIKEEDIPSAAKITRIRAALSRKVPILTGNNGVFLLQELAHGIAGPMAGFSYPEMLSGVHNLYCAGKVEEAHDLFDAYLPLLCFENQSQWGVRRHPLCRHACTGAGTYSQRPQGYRYSSTPYRRSNR
jgi:4-hydroxy-tetrahydrodipicolinate synthase